MNTLTSLFSFLYLARTLHWLNSRQRADSKGVDRSYAGDPPTGHEYCVHLSDSYLGISTCGNLLVCTLKIHYCFLSFIYTKNQRKRTGTRVLKRKREKQHRSRSGGSLEPKIEKWQRSFRNKVFLHLILSCICFCKVKPLECP